MKWSLAALALVWLFAQFRPMHPMAPSKNQMVILTIIVVPLILLREWIIQ